MLTCVGSWRNLRPARTSGSAESVGGTDDGLAAFVWAITRSMPWSYARRWLVSMFGSVIDGWRSMPTIAS
jgi:hypothetical protein